MLLGWSFAGMSFLRPVLRLLLGRRFQKTPWIAIEFVEKFEKWSVFISQKLPVDMMWVFWFGQRLSKKQNKRLRLLLCKFWSDRPFWKRYEMGRPYSHSFLSEDSFVWSWSASPPISLRLLSILSLLLDVWLWGHKILWFFERILACHFEDFTMQPVESRGYGSCPLQRKTPAMTGI